MLYLSLSYAYPPVPEYDLFEDSRFYRPMQGKLWRMLPIQTIRGCPFTCAYCNSPWQADIHKKEGYVYFRKQRIDLIREELDHCIKNYKADSFYFWADTFLAWTDREFNEFCEMYSESDSHSGFRLVLKLYAPVASRNFVKLVYYVWLLALNMETRLSVNVF